MEGIFHNHIMYLRSRHVVSATAGSEGWLVYSHKNAGWSLHTLLFRHLSDTYNVFIFTTNRSLWLCLHVACFSVAASAGGWQRCSPTANPAARSEHNEGGIFDSNVSWTLVSAQTGSRTSQTTMCQVLLLFICFVFEMALTPGAFSETTPAQTKRPKLRL